MNAIAEKLFAYYLDAVMYCRQHNISLEKIKRRDWKTWIVE